MSNDHAEFTRNFKQNVKAHCPLDPSYILNRLTFYSHYFPPESFHNPQHLQPLRSIRDVLATYD